MCCCLTSRCLLFRNAGVENRIKTSIFVAFYFLNPIFFSLTSGKKMYQKFVVVRIFYNMQGAKYGTYQQQQVKRQVIEYIGPLIK